MSEISKKYLKTINLKTTTKDEIKLYFLNSYKMYEKLFELLKNKNDIYERPNPLRQPLVFYYGHTATFFINKMLLSKLIDKPLNPHFESMFAIGVDEMSWDDNNKNNYTWPMVEEVQKYRDDVCDIVLEAIDNIELTFPINWHSPIWAILMGIEHEKIHLETSSVLLRELDLKYIKPNSYFAPSYDEKEMIFPKNEMIDIKGGEVKISKNTNDSDFYGWDNEYGSHSSHVDDFKVSKYLVSNGEFKEFVEDGGYSQDEFWLDDALNWKNETKAKMPFFWSKQNGKYFLRQISSITELALNLPAEINGYEAEAFLAWLNNKNNTSYRLISEDEYYKLINLVDESENKANLNLEFTSALPVDTYNFNGVYDIIGNVWQWSATCIYPFDGFRPHKIYEDFTMPTFDNKHFLIKGGSFMSSGNLALKESRYAFRKHFLQHSGFRYVSSNNKIENNSNIYESDDLISQYCEFHYGESYFNVENFCSKTVQILKPFIKNKQTKKALDLGCSVGRSSYELANIYDEVEGIDFSANFIKVAQQLQSNNKIKYKIKEEGDISSFKEISLKELSFENIANKVKFFQGDACNLKKIHDNYDLILCNNLIDRLYDPIIFLENIQNKINKNGILAISSPYTWLSEYTKKEKWLGGFTENGKEIYSIENLEKHLSLFKLKKIIDVEFVIKESKRKYQHSISQMSIWEKK